LDAPPESLTDKLALEKARETLKLDGLDEAMWDPKPEHRSIDPANKRDQYLARNALDPNRGSIIFVKRSAYQKKEDYGACAVAVELRGDLVTCQVTMGK
jgi:hypothetical protein